MYVKVWCGCGWALTASFDDREDAREWAAAAALERDCDDGDIPVAVEITEAYRISTPIVFREKFQPVAKPPARASSGPAAVFRALLRGDPCAYCGGPSTALDHIVPRSAGGDNSLENLAATCGPCNSRKRDSSLLGWLGWRGCDAERAEAEAILSGSRAWRLVGGSA